MSRAVSIPATVAALSCAALGLGALPGSARSAVLPIEHRIKAAFLYKFAGYADWPPGAFAGPDAPLTIAVAGYPRLSRELARLVVGRTSHGRTVTVARADPADLSSVHVLFVARQEADRLQEYLDAIASRPVLVVTEWEGALAQGSMINFVVADGRVRFEISLGEVERSGLTLSSRLLSVAHAVIPGRR